MEFSPELLAHCGVKTKDELDDILIADPDKYHDLIGSYYQKASDLKVKSLEEQRTADLLSANGVTKEEVETFAKKLGATNINQELINAYKKNLPPEKKDDTSASHQGKGTAGNLDRGTSYDEESKKPLLDKLKPHKSKLR